MNKLKNLFGVSVLALASLSTTAAEIGVVTWDPSASSDFNLSYDFQQWFQTSSGDSSWADVSGGVSDGNVLTGRGEVYSINNDFGFACAGCELTIEFGGLEIDIVAHDDINFGSDLDAALAWLDSPQNTGSLNLVGTDFIITGGETTSFLTGGSYWTLFSDISADFDEGTLSGMTTMAEVDAELASATDGDIWLSGTFGAMALTSGALNGTGTVEYIMNIEAGMAYGSFAQDGTFFPPLSIFVDSWGNGDANVLANDATTIFTTPGDPTSGVIFATFAGDGSLNADSIPEPTSIALFGLSLLGLAGAARRKQS